MKADRVATRVKRIDDSHRRVEIARMLAGSVITDEAPRSGGQAAYGCGRKGSRRSDIQRSYCGRPGTFSSMLTSSSLVKYPFVRARADDQGDNQPPGDEPAGSASGSFLDIVRSMVLMGHFRLLLNDSLRSFKCGLLLLDPLRPPDADACVINAGAWVWFRYPVGIATATQAREDIMTDSLTSQIGIEDLTQEEALVALKRLAAEIAVHDRSYHQEDAPTISDADYDALRQSELRQIEARFPGLVLADGPRPHQVGAAPASGFGKITHRVPMLSLDNAFSDEDVRDFRRPGAAVPEVRSADGCASAVTAEPKDRRPVAVPAV
jgi:hypothetical protein